MEAVTRQCKKCEVFKPLTHFHRVSKLNNNRRHVCIECINAYIVEYRRNNKIDPPETKMCPKCKQEKGIDDFYRNRSARNGYDTYCKKCKRQANYEYRNGS